MAANIDAIMGKVAAQVEGAFQRAADQMTHRVKDRLEEAYPPSSKPGENPHKRTGRLMEGIQFPVTRNGEDISATFDSEAPYTKKLEDSGRPIYSDIIEEFPGEVAAAMRDAST